MSQPSRGAELLVPSLTRAVGAAHVPGRAITRAAEVGVGQLEQAVEAQGPRLALLAWGLHLAVALLAVTLLAVVLPAVTCAAVPMEVLLIKPIKPTKIFHLYQLHQHVVHHVY